MSAFDDDADKIVRRLAEEHGVPYEHVEAEFESEVDRACARGLVRNRLEFIRIINELCFADDPDVAAGALELAGRLSPYLQQLGDHDG